MPYDYDDLYGSTAQALGDPMPALVDFFAQRQRTPLRVLDVGCGQGRDAVFIARMGHRVVGIDLSPNGIRDMIAVADAENLDIEGIAGDITTYVPDGAFDVVLFDRVLHMLPADRRIGVLGRLIGSVVRGGWTLIADERSNMDAFRNLFAAQSEPWKTELDRKGCLFLRRM